MIDYMTPIRATVAAAAVLALTASACASDDSQDAATKQRPATPSDADMMPTAVDVMPEAVAVYAEGVHASYTASMESAMAMDAAIDRFIDNPGPASMDGAKRAWLTAREDYGPTEAFRFYGGPIDDEETGTEGLINAWPLDEAYIDYVEGAPDAGIVNDPDGYPIIDAELLLSLNEQGGEANVSTGWHAIEFLLWGQDLSEDGPGVRPVEDYTTNPNADRRAVYLAVATDLLVEHLRELQAAWAPGKANYRADFVALDPGEAMRMILTGVGELSRGELAGERMNVAYTERSQEDEHSCFADNTTRDIIGNARGIQMVLTGQYPRGVTGPGIIDLVQHADSGLADNLEQALTASLAAVESIPAPFDQHLRDGISDNDPGRKSVLAGIEALGELADAIVQSASALSVTINVS